MPSNGPEVLRLLFARYWKLLALVPAGLSAISSLRDYSKGNFSAWTIASLAFLCLAVAAVRWPRIAVWVTKVILGLPPPVPNPPNIFRGPFPYKRPDSLPGRLSETERCLLLAREWSFLLIEGESGCGKSSLLMAALEPALDDTFTLIRAALGDDPIGRLSAALRGEEYRGSPQPIPVESLRAAIDTAHARAASAPPPQRPILLCIDQFESLFATTPDTTREALMALLRDAVAAGSLRLIILIRDDFDDLFTKLCRQVEPSGSFLNPGHAYSLLAFSKSQAEGVLRTLLEPLHAGDPLRKQQLDDFADELTAELLTPPRDRRLSPRDRPTVLPVELQVVGKLIEDFGTSQLSPGRIRDLGGKTGLLRDYIDQAKTYVWRKTAIDGDKSLLVLRRLVSPARRTQQLTADQVAEKTGLPASLCREVLDAFAQKGLVRRLQVADALPPRVLYELTHSYLVQVLVEAPQPILQQARAAEERLNFWSSQQRSRPTQASWLRGLLAQPLPVGEALRLRRFAVNENAAMVRRSLRAFVVRAALVLAPLTVALVALVNAGGAEGRQVAHAEQLAGEAMSYLETNLDRALLLGVEAQRTTDNFDTRNTLLKVLQTSPRLRGYLWLGSVESLAFSADSTELAAGDEDGALQVWDLPNSRSLGTVTAFTGENASVQAVAFSADGRTVSAGGLDGSVRTWELPSLRPLGEPLRADAGGVSDIAYSPVGRTLAVAYSNGPVIVWDLAARPRRSRSLPDRTSGAESLAFSRDGSTLLVGVETRGDDALSAWSLDSSPPKERSVAFGGENLTLSTDGRFVASDLISENNRMAIEVRNVEHEAVYRLAIPSDEEITAKVFAAGAFLISDDSAGTLSFWNLDDPAAPPEHFESHFSAETIEVSPDGTILAISGQPISVGANSTGKQMLLLVDVQKHLPLGTSYVAGSDAVSTLVPSPDGHCVAASVGGQNLSLLDLDGHCPFASPLSSRPRVEWYAHFNADSKALIVAANQDEELLWKFAEGKAPSMLFPELRRETRSANDALLAAAFSPAGDTVAFAYGKPKPTVTLQDLQTLQTTALPLREETVVTSVTFSPDGRSLALRDEHRVLQVWDLKSHRLVCAPPILPTDQNRPVLAFSPDGAVLASGTAKDTVVFVDVASCRPFGEPLEGHQDSITDISFSPDGKILASTDSDETVRLWDVASRRPLFGPLIHPHGVVSLAFAPGGKEVLSGGRDGSVVLWDVDPGSWQQRACRRAGRNLSLEEWRKLVSSNLPYERTCREFPSG